MSLITLDQFKEHARIDGDEQDADLQIKVDAANAYVLGYLPAQADDWEPPSDLVQAALLIAAHWYENREASLEGVLAEIPVGAADIIQNHREWVF